MPTKQQSQSTADKLADSLGNALAVIKHGMERDAVRRAANDTTEWSLGSGGDDAYSDRYMKNIGKGGLKTQQMDMRDTADDEARKNDKSIPSYKEGGVVKETGVALLHKGEKVIPKGEKTSMREECASTNKGGGAGSKKHAHGVIMLIHKGGRPLGGLAVTFGKKKGGGAKKTSGLKKG